MSVLLVFSITYASGLTLAMLWIFATAIHTKLEMRRAIAAGAPGRWQSARELDA